MPNVGIIVTTREDGSIEVKSLGKVLTKTGVEGEKSAKKTTTAWGKVKSTMLSVSGTMKDFTKKIFNLKNAVFALAGSAGIGFLVKSFVKASSTIEDFKTRLISLTKSEELAHQKLKALSDFASRAPFQLPEIIEAGITLEAFGGKSEKLIRVIGDLAAFMGVKIGEAAAAFGRAFAAGAGAADILRERGVLAMVKLKAGIKDLSKLTLPEFRKVLIETLSDTAGKVFGATERLAKTLTGQLSMMSDAVFKLNTVFGEALAPTIKDLVTNHLVPVVNKTREWASANKELIRIKFKGFVLETIQLIRSLVGAFDILIGVIRAVNGIWQILRGTFFSVAAAITTVINWIARLAEFNARLTDKIGLTSNAVKQWTGLIIGSKRATEDFTNKTAKSFTEAFDSISKVTSGFNDEFGKLIDSIKKMPEQVKDGLDAAAGSFDELKKSSSGTADKITKTWAEMGDKLKKSFEALDIFPQARLDAQVGNIISSFEAVGIELDRRGELNIDTAGKLRQKLIEKLKGLGDEAAQSGFIVDDAQIEQLKSLLSDLGESSVTSSQKVLSSIDQQTGATIFTIEKAVLDTNQFISSTASKSIAAFQDIGLNMTSTLLSEFSLSANAHVDAWESATEQLKELDVSYTDSFFGELDKREEAFDLYLKSIQRKTGRIQELISQASQPQTSMTVFDNSPLHSGTPYVPKTARYLLERGEAVIPADENPNNPANDNRRFDQSTENHFHFGAAPENQMEAEDMMVRALRKAQDRVF